MVQEERAFPEQLVEARGTSSGGEWRTSRGDWAPGESRALAPTGDEKGGHEEDVQWWQRSKQKGQVEMTWQCVVVGILRNVWDVEKLSKQRRGRRPSDEIRQKEWQY